MARTWTRGADAGTLGGLGEELRELFESALDAVDGFMDGLPVQGRRFPAIEVHRTGDGYRLIAALPGVTREAIELSIDGPTVRLEGERRGPELAEGASAVHRERAAGRFRRTIRLPEAVDATAARARLDAGLLTVELPRSPKRRARTITIEAEEGE